jgi:uncharacterized protein with von Willebrand factor type A (vWA) domain
MGKSLSPSEQRARRQRRGERAFLFDSSLNRCLAEFERDDWEWALSACGGDTLRAAQQCGLSDVSPGAKALWGRSAEEARGTYRQWQKRRGGK